MEPLRHLVCLRHGETEMSRAGLFAGRTDVPLDEGGRRAAAAWADTFGPVAAGGLHSPLVRAAGTASLAGIASTPSELLREWDLGDLEGRSSEEYRQAHPSWSLFEDGPPGGEDVDAVLTRVRAAVVEVTETYAGEDVAVLVGHGQMFKLLTCVVLGLAPELATRFTLGPARAAVFSWRPSVDGYTLAGWNRTPVPIDVLLGGNS